MQWIPTFRPLSQRILWRAADEQTQAVCRNLRWMEMWTINSKQIACEVCRTCADSWIFCREVADMRVKTVDICTALTCLTHALQMAADRCVGRTYWNRMWRNEHSSRCSSTPKITPDGHWRTIKRVAPEAFSVFLHFPPPSAWCAVPTDCELNKFSSHVLVSAPVHSVYRQKQGHT